MSAYDLERLSVLVVDDSAFGRALISRVLRSLGIRQIVTAGDGSEAIHFLKTVAVNPQKVGVQRFDLIICDWVMSPVDGVMLLKWLRRHKDSPDRFIPFIMVSAQAEEEKVREARDLGANEFLAKPFSINTITAKLLQLIDRPRPFVYTRDYFGPDRRRQQQLIGFPNRRQATKENVALVHTPRLPTTFPDKIVAYYINSGHRLRDIVAGLGAVDTKEPGQLGEEVVAAAENEILAMESDYADWVRGTVDKLIQAYQALRQQPKNHWKYFRIINELAHDLRGEGQTFGYPLVTDFGKSLFEYTRLNIQPDEKFLDLLHAHIEAIQVIIRQKIKGQGGEIGKTIVATLEAAKRKWEQQSVAS